MSVNLYVNLQVNNEGKDELKYWNTLKNDQVLKMNVSTEIR